MEENIILPAGLEELLFGKKYLELSNAGIVVHVFGKAGTGKTTLALQLACSVASLDKKVIYIDTEGKVSGGKIKRLTKTKTFSKVNRYLKLFNLKNFDKQQELIQNLEFYIINQEIGLIIVDTITNLYRQGRTFGPDSRNHYERLAFQVAYLHQLATTKGIPVILFNQATIPKNEKNPLLILKQERVNPVARAVMGYWAQREVILVNHGWGNFEGRIPGEFKGSVKFRIDSKGIIRLED